MKILTLALCIFLASTSANALILVKCTDPQKLTKAFSFTIDPSLIGSRNPLARPIDNFKTRGDDRLFTYCQSANIYKGRADFKCFWEPYNVFKSRLTIFESQLKPNSVFKLELKNVDENTGRADGSVYSFDCVVQN